MDVDAIGDMATKVRSLFETVSHCGCEEACVHIGSYVEGQLTDWERKNVEQIALNAGVAPRTLQEFLSNYD